MGKDITKINNEIAKGQAEILILLEKIGESLIDCRTDKNDWSDVGDTIRLKNDLKNILQYRGSK